MKRDGAAPADTQGGLYIPAYNDMDFQTVSPMPGHGWGGPASPMVTLMTDLLGRHAHSGLQDLAPAQTPGEH